MEIILRVPDWFVTVSEHFMIICLTFWATFLVWVAFLFLLWCMGKLLKYLDKLQKKWKGRGKTGRGAGNRSWLPFSGAIFLEIIELP